jgi:queuine tRNA-ribosyltransferase
VPGGRRRGRLQTPHGEVRTPAVVAVAPHGAVPALSSDELRACGVQALMVDTLDLALRPGIETVRRLGGLHHFLGWDGPTIAECALPTVSGQDDASGEAPRSRRASGQRSRVLQLDDGGVVFTSHVDGARVRLSPEQAVLDQIALGADVLTTLAVGEGAGNRRARESAVERWMDWLERSVANAEAMRLLVALPPALMETQPSFHQHIARFEVAGYLWQSSGTEAPFLDWSGLPPARIRFARGIPDLEDMEREIELGFDLLACEFPIRDARRGRVYTAGGPMDLLHPDLAERFEPLDQACACEVCRTFTQAYLHHLFAAEELLGYRLAAIHNLTWVCRLVRDARTA